MEILSKISAKQLCGDIKKAPEGELYVIAGNAVGIESGESNFGPWECLVGDFRAKKADGQVFSAGKAFVPEIVLNVVKPYIMSSEGGVQFAVRVGKKLDETVVCGYRYTVENLSEPVEDPLTALLNSATPKQIEATKKGGK